MVSATKMSQRGQLIVPKDIRKTIGAEKDTLFIVSTLDDQTIIMKKVDTKTIEQEFRKLKK